MKREFLKTADGSLTIHLPDLNEQYHSKHGAIQEAKHVFIKMGWDYYFQNNNSKKVSILEIGFGTGLNCLLTIKSAIDYKNVEINYTGIEAFPVSEKEWSELNYHQLVELEDAGIYFKRMHELKWEIKEEIFPSFNLLKNQKKFQDVNDKNTFDLIYFDAFGARVQPELWTEDVFLKMYNSLKKNGVLVTYSAKGSVRRAMQNTGFKVERLNGPPGKREMLRAVKF